MPRTSVTDRHRKLTVAADAGIAADAEDTAATTTATGVSSST